jgi:hypothetical protein
LATTTLRVPRSKQNSPWSDHGHVEGPGSERRRYRFVTAAPLLQNPRERLVDQLLFESGRRLLASGQITRRRIGRSTVALNGRPAPVRLLPAESVASKEQGASPSRREPGR